MCKQSMITPARELLWKGQSEDALWKLLFWHFRIMPRCHYSIKEAWDFLKKLPRVIWMSRVRCKCRMEKWGDYLFKPNHLLYASNLQGIRWLCYYEKNCWHSKKYVGRWTLGHDGSKLRQFSGYKKMKLIIFERCIKVKLPFLSRLLFLFETSQVHDVAISKR